MQEFTPKEYFQIDIANLAGKDKLTWDERLSWFKENENNLLDLTQEVDKPYQYYAAVTAYQKAIAGEVNHHPIALDATWSGLQCLSVLTCDPMSASICNVLDIGSRADGYTILYKKIVEKIGHEVDHITRQTVKEAIMPAFYSSMVAPQRCFGDYLEAFIEVAEENCPYTWQLNSFLRDAWNPKVESYGWVMPDNFHVHVKVYNNAIKDFNFLGEDFTFQYRVNAPNPYGRAYSANLAHATDSLIVREVTALAMHNPRQIQRIRDILAGKGRTSIQFLGNRKNQAMVETLVDLYQKSGFLSARVLDYIDEKSIKLIPEDSLVELLSLVPEKPFDLCIVHDSFHVLPNYGNDIRRLYIAQLAKIARSNLLQFILDQMPIEKVKFNKADPEMWKEVQFSEYALS